MTWNVFMDDFNNRAITPYNVFNHGRYEQDISKLLKKCKDRDEFSKELESVTMYYFWSKCEYEIIISSWVGHSLEKKIDVYDQLKLNWDAFANYVWSFKDERKK